jgi:hypothetical protein
VEGARSVSKLVLTCFNLVIPSHASELWAACAPLEMR